MRAYTDPDTGTPDSCTRTNMYTLCIHEDEKESARILTVMGLWSNFLFRKEARIQIHLLVLSVPPSNTSFNFMGDKCKKCCSDKCEQKGRGGSVFDTMIRFSITCAAALKHAFVCACLWFWLDRMWPDCSGSYHLDFLARVPWISEPNTPLPSFSSMFQGIFLTVTGNGMKTRAGLFAANSLEKARTEGGFQVDRVPNTWPI